MGNIVTNILILIILSGLASSSLRWEQKTVEKCEKLKIVRQAIFRNFRNWFSKTANLAIFAIFRKHTKNHNFCRCVQT